MEEERLGGIDLPIACFDNPANFTKFASSNQSIVQVDGLLTRRPRLTWCCSSRIAVEFECLDGWECGLASFEECSQVLHVFGWTHSLVGKLDFDFQTTCMDRNILPSRPSAWPAGENPRLILPHFILFFVIIANSGPVR